MSENIVGRCAVFIDADDTLWDNNIYYEQAMSEYLMMLEKFGFGKECVEPKLRKREMENVQFHGYGSKSFAVSLLEVYEETCRAAGIEIEQHIIEHIDYARNLTRNFPINLLPGVAEVLPELSKKHRLFILTKGEEQEQIEKVERSGISHFFEQSIVVEEKDENTYRDLLGKYSFRPETTWMVGNSPRSDINPAKAVGMKTVLIPYHSTWVHEIEEINRDGYNTVILDSFAGLAEVL